MYGFRCSQGGAGYDDIEVYDISGSTQTYPKFRYWRKNQGPWTLDGKSSQESSKVREVLSEIWEGALQ